MSKSRRTRDWAKANAGVFALLPWRKGRRAEWEEHVCAEVSAYGDWSASHSGPNLAFLEALGQVFDEYASTGSLSQELERKLQGILANIYPTYQARGEGAGIGWNVRADCGLFRRVGQLAGRLWEAIGQGAVGTRLQRCRECGMVRYFLRPPRPGDYACSKACQEVRRQLRAAGSDVSAAAQGYIATPKDWFKPKVWHVTQISPLPTAPAAPITEHIDLPAEATDDGEGEKSPAH